MHIFYTPDIESENYILNEDESKHAVRVLRLSENDVVTLIDGKGGFYYAKITDANPKRCRMSVIHKKMNDEKKDFRIHIAISPTKSNERFEWFLEKATEIGIDEITPIISDRSERKTLNTGRMEKILISAIKQSIKARLPALNPVCHFSGFVKENHHCLKYIAHCQGGEKLHLKNLLSKGEDTLILIGPEGDFCENEIKLALENNFKPVSLGNSRLRTETAGVVAAHIISLVNE
jgi:16S rRNA (uracil1498-N3)-methyltransferase